MAEPPSLQSVRAAAALLRGVVPETPTLRSEALSQRSGAEVSLKLENLQLTGSFKARGALVKLRSLEPAARERGVVAVSAGNHAQGVAFHARALGIPARVVMPRPTPATKVERVRALGAEVVLRGETLDQSRVAAQALAAEHELTLVHPYDDPHIISGQGTVALELLAARPDLDALLVPVGGGGLAAGMALVACELRPGIEIFGVQTERFPSMDQALRGEPVVCGHSTLAEGVAVKEPGRLSVPILRERLAGVLRVDEDGIERAIRLLLDAEKLLVEGAGAVGVAALLAEPGRFAGRRVGIVLSGGNLDPSVLAAILARGLARSGRLVRLRVDARDAPGELARIASLISAGDASIAEVHHQRAFSPLSLESAEVEFVLQVRGREQVGEILAALRGAGYAAYLPDSGFGAERKPAD